MLTAALTGFYISNLRQKNIITAQSEGRGMKSEISSL